MWTEKDTLQLLKKYKNENFVKKMVDSYLVVKEFVKNMSWARYRSVIVVNLLIGLAVDDIKAVQDQAILKRLAMQVELVLDVERLLPNFLLRRLTKQKEVIRQSYIS